MFMCFLNCSVLVADVVIFDYLINGELLSSLDENETVFLNFSRKTQKNFTLKQVS